jgi:hypothetical protein
MMFSLFASAFAFASANAFIQDCGSQMAMFQFENLQLTPDPPVLGQPVQITGSFFNSYQPILNGTVYTSVSLDGIYYPVSEEILCARMNCPIPLGNNSFVISSTWPSQVSGRITSKLLWTSKYNEELMCIEASFMVEHKDSYSLRGFHQWTPRHPETFAKRLWNYRTKEQKQRQNTTSSHQSPYKNMTLYMRPSRFWKYVMNSSMFLENE